MINLLKDLIDSVPVVSFDIFDTLVCRKVEEPESVFELMNLKVDDAGFHLKRQVAQQKAFQYMHECGKHEISMSDIYRFFNNDESESLRQLEEDIELEVIYLNPEIIEVFDYCLNNSKKIVLISDMYLEKEFFKRLFNKLNFFGYESVYISSECNATKRDYGELFNHVLSDLNISPFQLLHIGDNYHSDYLRAKEIGIHAFHYNVAKETCQTLEESIFVGVQKEIMKTENKNVFYQFGVECGSILFSSYYDWLKKEIDQKFDRVLFVARDGFLLHETWEKDEETLTPSEYLYGSRVLFKMAEINEEQFHEQIDFLLSGAELFSVHEYYDRIGVEVPSQQLIERAGFMDKYHIVKIEEQSNMANLFISTKNKILNKAYEIRRNYFKYLCGLGLHNCEKIAVVDIGWSGTTQEYLEPLIKDFFDDIQIEGYYFGLIDSDLTQTRHKKFSMKSFIHDKKILNYLDKNRVIVELMFSAPHKTIIALDDNLEPIYDKERGKTSDFESVVIDINLGISDVLNQVEVLKEHFSLALNYQNLMKMLESIIHSPKIDFVQEIGMLSNFDAWGNTKNFTRYYALRDELKMRNSNDVINSWKAGYLLLNKS